MPNSLDCAGNKLMVCAPRDLSVEVASGGVVVTRMWLFGVGAAAATTTTTNVSQIFRIVFWVGLNYNIWAFKPSGVLWALLF